MKKFIMTCAAAMVAMVMDAQFYAGGSLGIETESHDGDTETTLLLKPEVGYNLNEKFSVGMVFGYGESGRGEHKLKSFTINPYVRYNALSIDKLTVFLDGGFGYENQKLGEVKTNIWSFGVKPGLAIALNKKISFVTHVGFVGFESSKPNTDGAKATNTFGAKVNGNKLDFGVYYNF
jgi:hypothetical protein